MTYLLDTNIVTAIVKRNPRIKNKLREVERLGEEVSISCITYYEVKRGLLAVNATTQLANFSNLCKKIRVLLLDDMEILEKACEIHAELKVKGTLLEDADILIAATAIARGLILVSHDADMLRVPGITLEDWLTE